MMRLSNDYWVAVDVVAAGSAAGVSVLFGAAGAGGSAAGCSGAGTLATGAGTLTAGGASIARGEGAAALDGRARKGAGVSRRATLAGGVVITALLDCVGA